MSEPKYQKCDFAERTPLSHVNSVVCVFQGARKQGGFGDTRCKRRGGTRPGRPQHRNLAHRKLSRGYESYLEEIEEIYDPTLIQLERTQRMRKWQPLPPQLDVKIS